MPNSHTQRPVPPHIMTLVIATASGALAMNVFLPSLPGMAVHFQAEYGLVQLALSLYLAATAILQLGIGPASDRFGRRPVMLTSFAIFLVGSVAAVYAPTIQFLLAARVLQAFAIAGVVLSRAIVRDTAGPEEAASKLAYITMGMALVPMLGPLIGGFLDELYGWQASFALTFVFGLIAFVTIYFDLRETNTTRSTSMAAQIRHYPELFRSRRFWGYSLTAACASGTYFAFLGGGPLVASEILGLGPAQYGLYFTILPMGYVFGNFLSGRYTRRVGLNTMMLSGNVVAASGMAVSLLLFAVGVYHPLALFGPAVLVGVGNGLTLPNANAGMVSVRPHLAGSASGLGGALQIGGGGMLSVVSGALLSPSTGAWPLLWLMLVASLVAIVFCVDVIRISRKPADLGQETVSP